MKKNYKIGCYQWMIVVGWPNPEEDFSCCFECHETLAHIQYRVFKSISYSVCCGVQGLCLKKLKNSVIIEKYDDAVNMTLEDWMNKWVPLVIPTTAAGTDGLGGLS